MDIIIAPVHTTGEDESTMDCDYVIASATHVRAKARRLRKDFRTLAKNVVDLEDIRIWDSSMYVVSHAVVVELVGDDRMEQLIDTSGAPVILTVASIRFDAACDNYERIEAAMLHVGEDGVLWSFYPKHTTVQCETGRIEYANLEADPAKK